MIISKAELTWIYNDESSHLIKRVLFIALDMNRLTSGSGLGQYAILKNE